MMNATIRLVVEQMILLRVYQNLSEIVKARSIILITMNLVTASQLDLL